VPTPSSRACRPIVVQAPEKKFPTKNLNALARWISWGFRYHGFEGKKTAVQCAILRRTLILICQKWMWFPKTIGGITGIWSIMPFRLVWAKSKCRGSTLQGFRPWRVIHISHRLHPKTWRQNRNLCLRQRPVSRLPSKKKIFQPFLPQAYRATETGLWRVSLI